MNAIRELLITTGLALVSAGFLSTATPAQGQMIERSVFPGQCSPRGPANRMVEAGEEQCEPLSAAVASAIVPTISKGNPGKTDTKTGAGRNPGTPSTGGGGPGAGDPGHGNVGDPGTGAGDPGHGNVGDPGTGDGDPGHGGGGDPGTGGGDPDHGGGGDPGTGGNDPGHGGGGDPGTGDGPAHGSGDPGHAGE